jgi:hypothetical protein
VRVPPAGVSYNTDEPYPTVVTRTAAREGFEQFVGEAIELTAEEFSVARALRRGTRGPGGAAVDRLLKDSDLLWDRVVQPELDAYRDRTLAQFDVVLDYAAGDADIDAYRADLLAADSYAEALRADLPAERRDRIRDRLVDRHRRLGDAVAPLVAAPEDAFWPALQSAYDCETAADLVEEHFAFTGPLREHRGAFEMATAFDPGDVLGGGLLPGGLPTLEVEYTDEAIRAMRRAEEAVIADTRRELDRRY